MKKINTQIITRAPLAFVIVTRGALVVVLIVANIFLMWPVLTTYAAVTQKAPTENGLVGYWSMNEGAGNKVMDMSGNGNNGTMTGATWAAGKYGKALNFGGTGYVNMGNNSSLNLLSTITVSFWMKGVTTANTVLVEKSTDNTHFHFQTTDEVMTGGGNHIFFGISSGGFVGRVSSSAIVADGSWHHITGTFDTVSNTLKIYVDGRLDKVNSSATDEPISNSSNLLVGSRSGSFGFPGVIDEVRIYNRALSATEITNLYKSGAVTVKSGPALVQTGTCYLGGGSCTINMTNTAGNLLWVGINDYAVVSDGWSYSVSDTKGNTYPVVSVADSGNVNGPQLIATFYAANIPGGANTITCSRGAHNGGSGRCVVLEYSGLATASPLNGHAENTNTGTNFTTGNLTTTNNNDLLIGYFASRDAQTWSNLSWASRFSSNVDFGVLVQDKLVSAKGQYAATAIGSISSLGPGAINAFKSARGSTAINFSPTSRLTNGLVGYWTFDGKDTTATTATDRSGNGNTGTITGATPTIGKIGQALRFKSNEHISISPALNSTNIYTTSAWVRINGTTPDGYQCILSQDYNNNILCYGDSEKKFLAYANYTALYTDNTYPTGKWYHVSVVHNPTTQYIYIDGVLAGTSSNTNASSLQYIGSAENTVETLNGDLDEVRIYNRALSAAEVKQLYLMGK